MTILETRSEREIPTAQEVPFHDNPLKKLARSKWSRLGLFVTLLTGGILACDEPQVNPSVASLPPKTTPLLGGNFDSAAHEFCTAIGLPHLVRVSPSSFICDSIVTPTLPKEKPSRPIFDLPAEAPIKEEPPSVYQVQSGDTLSQILEQIYGTDEVYGEHFRDTVFQNADWLVEKSHEAEQAIEKLKQHLDWTPRTSTEAWELFMEATRLIHPDDDILLTPQERNEENETAPSNNKSEEGTKEATREIGQSLPNFFGSGICTEAWALQPKGNDVCSTKPPYTHCVQLGSGETPSYTCAIPQIGGRSEGKTDGPDSYYFVVDQCPRIAGPCIGHLEKNKN